MTRFGAGLALVFLAGCGADPALAASLANAARPSRLPAVVACWEKELEASPTKTGYVATVDFVVEGSTSRIREPKVRALTGIPGEEGEEAPAIDPEREAAFRGCLEGALARSGLPKEADADGPGFATSGDLTVKGYRIAFVDASAKRRRAAEARAANVLLGPRANRCEGLYGHDPPRDAAVLYDEIGRAEARTRARGTDPDQRARELQKAYDAQIELMERLAADLAQPALPEANRARLREALAEAREAARKTGAKIGCAPPSR